MVHGGLKKSSHSDMDNIMMKLSANISVFVCAIHVYHIPHDVIEVGQC